MKLTRFSNADLIQWVRRFLSSRFLPSSSSSSVYSVASSYHSSGGPAFPSKKKKNKVSSLIVALTRAFSVSSCVLLPFSFLFFSIFYARQTVFEVLQTLPTFLRESLFQFRETSSFQPFTSSVTSLESFVLVRSLQFLSVCCRTNAVRHEASSNGRFKRSGRTRSSRKIEEQAIADVVRLQRSNRQCTELAVAWPSLERLSHLGGMIS